MILMKDITRDGNPVLRQEAAQVKFPLSKEDQQLAADMMEYLEVSQDPELCEKYGLRAGVGLAAPQVGVSEMMAAVLVPAEEEGGESPFKDVIINPVIVSHSVQNGALTEGEGCLSVDKEVPGFVPRHDRITFVIRILRVRRIKFGSSITQPLSANMKLTIYTVSCFMITLTMTNRSR